MMPDWPACVGSLQLVDAVDLFERPVALQTLSDLPPQGLVLRHQKYGRFLSARDGSGRWRRLGMRIGSRILSCCLGQNCAPSFEWTPRESECSALSGSIRTGPLHHLVASGNRRKTWAGMNHIFCFTAQQSDARVARTMCDFVSQFAAPRSVAAGRRRLRASPAGPLGVALDKTRPLIETDSHQAFGRGEE